MSGFEPGEGWREVERPDAAMHGEVVMYRAPRGDEPRVRTWVREVPVPPLPTEPGYYVAEWPDYGSTVVVELLGLPKGQWVDAGDRNYLEPDAVRALGPMVRLEPRAVTAKAVLDRVLHLSDTGSYADEAVHQVRGEFGVSS